MIVLPEVAQHFDEMGFAATEEAANPDGVLLGFSQASQVGLENPLHSARVFTIADKVLQLETKRLDLARVVADLGHLRDAVIEQLKRRGITEVQVAVRHGLMNLSVEVTGTAM